MTPSSNGVGPNGQGARQHRQGFVGPAGLEEQVAVVREADEAVGVPLQRVPPERLLVLVGPALLERQQGEDGQSARCERCRGTTQEGLHRLEESRRPLGASNSGLERLEG